MAHSFIDEVLEAPSHPSGPLDETLCILHVKVFMIDHDVEFEDSPFTIDDFKCMHIVWELCIADVYLSMCVYIGQRLSISCMFCHEQPKS